MPQPQAAASLDSVVKPLLTKVSTIGDAAMDKAISTPTRMSSSNRAKKAVGLHLLDPKLLKPHPRNSYVYGKDEDISELVELIRESRWVKPLVVTPFNVIVSGHRRWKAALELRLETVPVEVTEFENELAELEALLLENASRLKTTEQKVREASLWKEIETEKSRSRQISCLKQGNLTPVQENFPEREIGQSRDQLARRVGLGSGKTYEKAALVVAQIDCEIGQGNLACASALRHVLNGQSVDAAYRLLKKPNSERTEILELIASGKASTTKQAKQIIERDLIDSIQKAMTLNGFGVGDWVEVNNTAKNHIGSKGRVDLLMPVEQLVSVIIEGVAHSLHFSPLELTLIAKASPPVPFQVGDLVLIDIDRAEAIDAKLRKHNNLWGIVREIGELGSLKVDVGSQILQLLQRDLKPIDNPSSQLLDVAERVLRLRKLELDEIEEKMLDVLQRLHWFTAHQLIHLKNIEKLYAKTLKISCFLFFGYFSLLRLGSR